MKRISAQQRKINDRVAHQRWIYALKRERKRRNFRIRVILAYAQGISKEEFLLRNYNIHAPSKFNLGDNFDEVVTFLNKIRNESLVGRRRYSVNFKTIEEISPAAALVLTAEMDRWRRIKRAKLRPTELRKWNPTVRRLLNEMGFFEALEIENPCTKEDLIKNDDIQFIKFISGTEADGSYAKQLRQALEAVAGEINTKIFMYNGLIEAMNNAVQHAYPPTKSFHKEINRRWWMSGSYNQKTGRMTVMAYDQGVSIPVTLPLSRFWDIVYSFLSALGVSATDGNLIKAAMQIGKTQTHDENRGLGLHEMREFIIRSGKGLLRIISRNGDYVFYHNEKDETKDHKEPLGGTLIAWEIYTKDGDDEYAA